jgi:hypothetical protein
VHEGLAVHVIQTPSDLPAEIDVPQCAAGEHCRPAVLRPQHRVCKSNDACRIVIDKVVAGAHGHASTASHEGAELALPCDIPEWDRFGERVCRRGATAAGVDNTIGVEGVDEFLTDKAAYMHFFVGVILHTFSFHSSAETELKWRSPEGRPIHDHSLHCKVRNPRALPSHTAGIDSSPPQDPI